MNNDHKIAVIITVMLVSALMYIVYIEDSYEKKLIDEQKIECEKQGGILLRNTYKVGKNSKSERLCVSSEFILNPK